MCINYLRLIAYKKNALNLTMSIKSKKSVAIIQSNYIPWKGYFDMIAAVDEFIIYDEVQYTRRDWRNRNQIKTPRGLEWLTIPVQVKGKYLQKISETEVVGNEWRDLHWKKIIENYRGASNFKKISEWLEPLYLDFESEKLSEINLVFIRYICEYLEINTKITNSNEYSLCDGKSERLANLCLQVGASEYISGPSANGYIDETAFKDVGVELIWFDYDSYPEYTQLHCDKFYHNVSIIDLLFNCGPWSKEYLRFTK